MDLSSFREQCLGLVVSSTLVGYASMIHVDFEIDKPDPEAPPRRNLSLFAQDGPWRITSQGKMLTSLESKRASERAAELLDGKTITDLRVEPFGDLTVTFDEKIDLEVFAMPDLLDPHPSMDSWTWFFSEICVYPDPSGSLCSSPSDEVVGDS